MSHPHPLGVFAPSTEAIEAVHPQFVMEGLYRAREKTIGVLSEVRSQLRVGMTEDDARKLTLEIFAARGVTKHWHKPYVRFGAGTALTFHQPLQPDYRLQENDPYYLDLGPVWPDPALGLEYEGDFGDTLIFGKNPEAEKCANAARSLFNVAKSKLADKSVTGQSLYDDLRKRSAEMGYTLTADVEGHRLSDFPHHKYSKERLAKVPFFPKPGLWVLEIMLADPNKRFGAFFEDII